jgi:Fic family protein
MKSSHLFTNPAMMEPLLPQKEIPEVAELSGEILRLSGRLSGQIHAQTVRRRIAGLVREMNSYYSNLIEGHKTLPRDIERALHQDYSADATKRANQHLTRAHVEVEEAMIARLESDRGLSIHSVEFISWLHGEFYRRLPEELQLSTDRQGNAYPIASGALRTFEVEVGRHRPPHFGSLPTFMRRFEEFYSGGSVPILHEFAALAAAHHRLAWIHPFGDGNGRVARLYSYAWLIRARIDSLGLWTLSRGLARQRNEYFSQLNNADSRRWNDYDGRGHLSDGALGQFVLFFLRVMLDQITFMSSLLQLSDLAARMERYLQFELPAYKGRIKDRLARLLKAALVDGEIERGQVAAIVGLQGTAAREIIRIAISEQLMDSPTPKGRLSVLFNSKTLESYFPRLYQDLSIDATTRNSGLAG